MSPSKFQTLFCSEMYFLPKRKVTNLLWDLKYLLSTKGIYNIPKIVCFVVDIMLRKAIRKVFINYLPSKQVSKYLSIRLKSYLVLL